MFKALPLKRDPCHERLSGFADFGSGPLARTDTSTLASPLHRLSNTDPLLQLSPNLEGPDLSDGFSQKHDSPSHGFLNPLPGPDFLPVHFISTQLGPATLVDLSLKLFFRLVFRRITCWKLPPRQTQTQMRHIQYGFPSKHISYCTRRATNPTSQ